MPKHTINSPFDVRSNLFALISINLAVLSNDNPTFLFVIFGQIIILFLLCHAWKEAMNVSICAIILALLYHLLNFLPSGNWHSGLYTSLRLSAPFICASCMGYYFIKVSPANLLLAGLHRLHCPRALTTALAVMLRLLPTLSDNARAIREAMRIRGLNFRQAIIQPINMLEYFIIPLISATIVSGEALTATALSRGLGSPHQPTSIYPLKFTWKDWLLCLNCCLLVLLNRR